MHFSIRGCARIRARDFTRIDTLTIASVLPGVANNYPYPGSPMECDIPQLDTDYVRSSSVKYVKIAYLPLFSPKSSTGQTPNLQH